MFFQIEDVAPYLQPLSLACFRLEIYRDLIRDRNECAIFRENSRGDPSTASGRGTNKSRTKNVVVKVETP